MRAGMSNIILGVIIIVIGLLFPFSIIIGGIIVVVLIICGIMIKRGFKENIMVKIAWGAKIVLVLYVVFDLLRYFGVI